MTTKTLTAAALVLALMPTMGVAQDAPRGPQMPQFDFAAADADASGGISYPEFTAYLQAQMQERRAERIAARADRLLAAGDADEDGALTRDELIAGALALGDERQERMHEWRGSMQAEGQGRMRGDRDGHRMRGDYGGYRMHEHGGDDRRAHGMRGDRDRYGMRGDRDRDGMRGDRDGQRQRGMDPERMANRLFDRVDSNNDGQISPDEARIAQERMQERLERRQGRRSNG